MLTAITAPAAECLLELLCGKQVALPSGTMVSFGLSYCIHLNMSWYVN